MTKQKRLDPDNWDLPSTNWRTRLELDIAKSRRRPVLAQLDGADGATLEVPASFALVVDRVRNGTSWTLRLQYEVSNGVPLATAASSTGVDIASAIDELRAARPLGWWTRRAVSDAVVAVLADNLAAKTRLIYGLSDNEPATLEQIREAARDAIKAARDELAPTLLASLEYEPPRRNRVSTSDLQRVAHLYMEADGGNKTKAVAAQIDKPYSTTARWIAMAREAGYITTGEGM